MTKNLFKNADRDSPGIAGTGVAGPAARTSGVARINCRGNGVGEKQPHGRPQVVTSAEESKWPGLFRSRASLYDEKAGANLKMKVAVITGAAQGIGRRTAELLAGRGYHLALNDLREPAETCTALKSASVETLAFAGDIASESAVEQFAAAVDTRWSPSGRAGQ